MVCAGKAVPPVTLPELSKTTSVPYSCTLARRERALLPPVV
jgi:hypothetical protein